MEKQYKAGVLTISDACSRGEREDVSGALLSSRLENEGFERDAETPEPLEPTFT